MKRLLLLIMAFGLSAMSLMAVENIAASSPSVRWIGRYVAYADGSVAFDWSGTYADIVFVGSRLEMKASDTGKNYFNVFVDSAERTIVRTEGGPNAIVLFEGDYGTHRLRLQRRTEGEQGLTTVYGFATDGTMVADTTPRSGRHIEFIGDSLTCGFGTDSDSANEPFTPETENCDLAYGCYIARYFGADYNLVAHSGQGVVRNYGYPKRVSPYTMRERMQQTFDCNKEVLWDYSKSPYKPDLVVINLGTNDVSVKPQPTYKEFSKGYNDIIAQIRAAYGDVPILCVAPYLYDPLYDYIRRISLSGDRNLHFACILPGYCNNTDELGAAYHPNRIGQQKMAMLLIPYISTITGWPIKNDM